MSHGANARALAKAAHLAGMSLLVRREPAASARAPVPAPPVSATSLVVPAHLERPQLARCKPEKESRRRKTAVWLRQWCTDRGISRRDFIAMWGMASGVATSLWEGRTPFHLEDVGALPPRYQDEFLFDYRAFLARLRVEEPTATHLVRHG